MSERSVTPNGDKIRKLRRDLGWTGKQLAKNACCSEKSVGNAQNSVNIDLATLAGIAKALGVKVGELRKDIIPPETIFTPQIVMGINDKESAAILVEVIRQTLQATGEITIKFVRSGSVIVTLEMNEADALRLVLIFPNFREHARAALAQTPAGKAYFSGINPAGLDVIKIENMLNIIDAVQELWFTAGSDSPLDGTPAEPAPSPKPAPEMKIEGYNFGQHTVTKEVGMPGFPIHKPKKRPKNSPLE